MANAMNLQDMIAGLKDELMKGIVLQFARQSVLFQKLLPFRNVGSFSIKTWQATTVADAVFRDLGEGFANTKDEFTEKLEGVYLLGGKIELDSALLLPADANREIDPFAENVMLQAERYRYAYLNRFINGDRATDPKGFDGIRKRVNTVGGDQLIDAVALDLSASSANRQKFMDLVQQAIFETGADGTADAIITSKKGAWALQRAARREGLLNQNKDQFDRPIDAFMGVPILYAGRKGDQTTEIITSTETAAGLDGSSTHTSFYVVKLGSPYVQGTQLGGPVRTFDAIIDDGVTRRIVFQWPVGLLTMHKKAVTRIFGVIPI